MDEVTDTLVRIELVTANSERNENVALGWIELDKKNLELRDVTIDPEKPILLKYDTLLFKKVIINCLAK